MKKVFSAIFLVLCLFSELTYAQLQADGKAGLVITPTRVELEGKQRSASITIANNGVAKGSYRIELINKRMTEDGRLLDVTEEAKDDLFADKMLRISPRRVTIEPGQNQSIRILVRKPKDLAEGEYRTHLSVLIIPDEVTTDTVVDPENDKLVIAVKANYGVTIPVIVRNGNVSASGQMGAVKYHPANSDTKENAKVTFSVTRTGNSSLYGDIKVLHVSNNGTETLLKFMGGMAIYTPNKQRDFEIPLDSDAVSKIKNGSIRITYQAKEKSGGKMIAQNDLKL